MTVSTPGRHNRAFLFGVLALLLFTAIAVAGSPWWNEPPEAGAVANNTQTTAEQRSVG
ncbi:hypothetical protein [Streptomyces sp. NPDC096132]|uniref:hypothetical protein n=1 Tax=Streptomyces sp. NPDC096132 TaxID=3366075 RepID=UPI003826273A